MTDEALQSLLQRFEVGELLTRGILLVDDEEPNLAVLESFLDVDYRVYTASSGAEALAIAESTPLDLVIADQRMPGMTGVELLETLRAKRPDLLGIVLTGYSDTPALMSAINRARAFRYLRKPWQPEEVLAAVSQACRFVFHQRAVAKVLDLLSRRTEELDRALFDLQEAQKNMLHLDRLATAGRLTAGISHDLKNSLNGLLYLQQEALIRNTDPDFAQAIDVGLAGVRNMHEALSTMNAFVRQKRLSMAMEWFDPAVVVRDTVTVLHMDMDYRNRRVEVLTTEGLPLLLGDRQKLVQVLVNLVRNAIQATQARQKVSVSVTRSTEGIVYSVEDEGPGVPEDLRPTLFDAFVSSKGDAGVGLGLYMSKLIVAYHNGRIAALDRPIGGTRFEAVIPVPLIPPPQSS
jgi:two-component system sensor histidine kinase/response regulator